MSVKDFTCGNCKHYDPDECYCQARGEYEMYSLDGCDEWEEDKDELSEEEKREIIGDRKAHEIMEQEGHNDV